MKLLRTLTATTALLAMTAASVPASAHDHHGPDRHRHHDDNVDAGDVFIGAVLAGGLIALLSKKKSPPPSESVTYLDDDAPANGPPRASGPADEEAAIEACVAAAEIEGKRVAHISKIESVGDVRPDGPGYDVRGMLTLRQSYRDPAPGRRGFSCKIGDEGVEAVTLDGDRVAIR
ncbi:hypothetical protein BH09PSE4_BH09PSE4_16800 [soil metagenome]